MAEGLGKVPVHFTRSSTFLSNIAAIETAIDKVTKGLQISKDHTDTIRAEIDSRSPASEAGSDAQSPSSPDQEDDGEVEYDSDVLAASPGFNSAIATNKPTEN